MKYRFLLIALLLLLSENIFAQQEALFTQYLFNPMIYNPAYAGVYDMTSLNAASRIEKTSYGSGVFTNVFTANSTVPNTDGKMGLGINFINDRVGNTDGISSNNHTEVDIAYSYKIALGEYTYLSGGLQVALFNNKVNINGVNKEVFDDPNLGDGVIGKSQINFGTGLYLINEEKFFLSFAVPRILNSAVSYKDNVILPSQRTYYISGGAMINKDGNLPIRPAFMVRTMQGLPTSVDLSASVLLNEVIWAGLSMRSGGKKLAIVGQFDINQNVRIGYSTDLPLSGFVLKNLGTHELSVNINFAAFKNQVVVIPRYF